MATFTKATPGVLDYKIDYSSWLVTDTITDSTWTVPSGIIKDSDSNTTTTTTIVLSGGTAKRSYEIINTITTAAGFIDRRCFTVNVVTCRS